MTRRTKTPRIQHSDSGDEGSQNSHSAETENSNQGETEIPPVISIESTRTETEENDQNNPESRPRMVTIPEDELKVLRQLAGALRTGQPLSQPAGTTESQKPKRLSTKNIKIEKFSPDRKRYLVDYGLSRWMEQFDRELDFEFRSQGVVEDDDTRKMALFRYMDGKAADYARQMAASFDNMNYAEVQNNLRERFQRKVSKESRDAMIQHKRRWEKEEPDEYLARLITTADSMPDGRAPYEELVLGTFVRHANPKHTGQMRFELMRLETQHASFDSKCDTLLRMLEALTEDERNQRRSTPHEEPKRKRTEKGRAYHTAAEDKFQNEICEYENNGSRCGGKGHNTWYHRKFFPNMPRVTPADIAQRKAQFQRQPNNRRQRNTGRGEAHAVVENQSKRQRHEHHDGSNDRPRSSQRKVQIADEDEASEPSDTCNEETSENDQRNDDDGYFSHHVATPEEESQHDPQEMKWGVDTCASFHMTGDKKLLENIRRASTKTVRVAAAQGSNGAYTSKWQGDVHMMVKTINHSNQDTWKEWTLTHVRYVPGLTVNLISVSQLLRQNYLASITPSSLEVTNNIGQLALTAPIERGIYVARTRACRPSSAAYFVGQTLDSAENWHRRLGHLNYGYIQKIIKHGTATGIQLKKRKTPDGGHCEVCQIGKIRRAKIPKQATRTQEEKDAVGSVDCVGPLTPQSNHNHRYIFFHTFRNFIEVEFGSHKVKPPSTSRRGSIASTASTDHTHCTRCVVTTEASTKTKTYSSSSSAGASTLNTLSLALHTRTDSLKENIRS
jgi:hypothetical protein